MIACCIALLYALLNIELNAEESVLLMHMGLAVKLLFNYRYQNYSNSGCFL